MKKSIFRIHLLLSLFLIAVLISSCSKIPGSITVINSATQEEKKAGVEEQQKLEKYADDQAVSLLSGFFIILAIRQSNKLVLLIQMFQNTTVPGRKSLLVPNGSRMEEFY